MTLKDVINNEKEILACAKSFRKDANGLMKVLAKDFNFRLKKSVTFPKEIYDHKYRNKGLLRNEWTYFFHGAECRFDNLCTGQVVELIYITRPEFGFVDGYFLYNYMATTDNFKDLAIWFGDHLNVWKAIDILADKKVLTRKPEVLTKRNIIAL